MDNYVNVLYELDREIEDHNYSLKKEVFIVRDDQFIKVDNAIYYPIIDYYFDQNHIFNQEYEKSTLNKLRNELIKYTIKLKE